MHSTNDISAAAVENARNNGMYVDDRSRRLPLMMIIVDPGTFLLTIKNVRIYIVPHNHTCHYCLFVYSVNYHGKA